MHKPPTQATALTASQVEKIRAAARSWRRGPGFSARIDEVLAVRKCDVDVTSSPATVRICGTIVSPAGRPTHRQAHPKTAKSIRTVSVPSFASEVLRARLVKVAQEDREHPEDLDVLLEFYDYPAEHWVHLRTTNPIESTFATVRHVSASRRDLGPGPPGSRWRSS